MKLAALIIALLLLLPITPASATTPTPPTCDQPQQERIMPTETPSESVEITVLIDMAQPQLADLWRIVNDDVMGGVSKSAVRITATGTALFTGTVSLENNGGFASMQARFNTLDLSSFTGLDLTLCGDGKRYGFSLRERNQRIVHQFEFDTERGVWATVRIPFTALIPKFFGRWLNANENPIDLRQVNTMSLIIDNKQTGAFALELRQISLYKAVP